MIKRYAMKMVGSIATSVESEGGAYVRYADIARLLEEKTLEQHRAEFELFCGKHGLSVKQDMSTGSGLFNSHVVGWMWKAWKAARGVTE